MTMSYYDALFYDENSHDRRTVSAKHDFFKVAKLDAFH